MDVVAYDTIEPVVLFAASDVDRRAATNLTGVGVDLRCVDGLEDALAVVADTANDPGRTDATENDPERTDSTDADPERTDSTDADPERTDSTDTDPELTGDAADGPERADGAVDGTEPIGRTDERVDCVVTTDSLADGTGVELADAVRERDDDLPVIYVPESGSVADAEAATAAGATVYLPRERAADGELRERIDDVVDDYDRRRQLARERAMFAALLESAPLPLYAKDAEARHVAVSSYVATGYDRSPLGSTDVELYGGGGDRAHESYRDDRSVIETGDPILEKERRGTSSDGEAGWYRTTKHPWRTPDGEIQGLVGVTRPITRVKEREQQLERQRWRLQQFAQFTSTELREPVTTALDALDRATTGDGSLAADAEPSLEEIDDALDHMQSLIDTLLTMARPESEPAEMDWIDLEVAVRQSWNAIEDVAATLECAINERLEIRADPDQIHRLLEQLFRDTLGADSAVAEGDAADASVTRVRVGLSETGFYVEDDGPLREYSEDAEFEYQSAGHRVAIARDVADAHGWSIGVTQGTDGGTRDADDGTRFVVEDCLFRPVGLTTAIEGSPAPLDRSGDVGDATPSGDATKPASQDDAEDAWTVRGGGHNVWQDVREFHGVWAAMKGDVRVEARVTDFEPVHERCKAGIALFDPASGGVLSYVGLTGTVETESMSRSRTDETITRSAVPDWDGPGLYYRIDRVDDRTVCSVSSDGEDWTVVDHRRFYGPESVAAGLAVCSHSPERQTTATFEEVRVVELEVSE